MRANSGEAVHTSALDVVDTVVTDHIQDRERRTRYSGVEAVRALVFDGAVT